MSTQPKSHRRIAAFRSEADAIGMEGEPRSARMTLLVLGGFLVGGLVLASQANLDRVVTGTGQLITREPTVVVQSLNRAIITSLNVREGDRVKAGDVLATLDPTFTEADVAQLEVQVESYDAEIARLEAELEDQPLPSGLSPRYAELQRNLMLQRRAQRAEQLRSFEAKIAQLRATTTKLDADQRRYAERAKISKEIEGMRQQLANMQHGSRLQLLQAIDQRMELARQAELEANSLVEARHQLETARAEREAFVEQWRTQVRSDLVERRTARDGAAEQLAKAKKNHDLVTLRAPADAIVLNAAKLSVGSVLTEATPLFTLVPVDAPIEAEVSIDARDIGFVRTEDTVVVKLESFNYMQHGFAEGRVRVVSEDAFTTKGDDGKAPVRPYYRALVTVDKAALHDVPSGFRLIPGMPVTADIKIGTRNLLTYVAHGITRSFREAMREP